MSINQAQVLRVINLPPEKGRLKYLILQVHGVIFKLYRLSLIFFFFKLVSHTLQLARSWFPDQGLNSGLNPGS